MPKKPTLNKILIIGSGPIIIGQTGLNLAMEMEEKGILAKYGTSGRQ